MLEKLANRHKIGVIRAVKGMMRTSDQMDMLVGAGVERIHIKHIGKDPTEHIANLFRDGDDVLVVPFIGVLGKWRYDLLKLIAPTGATLYNLAENEDLPISQAVTFAYINECCANAQTAPARAASARSGNKGGAPRKFRGKALAQVRKVYESGEGTIADVCDRFGVSKPWLHGQFGGRDAAVSAACKLIANK